MEKHSKKTGRKRVKLEQKLAAERRAQFLADLAAQRCPKCGSAEVAGILYGLPGCDEVEADLEAGRLAAGGCVVCGDDPVWHCWSCRHQWGRPSEARAEPGDVADGLG